MSGTKTKSTHEENFPHFKEVHTNNVLFSLPDLALCMRTAVGHIAARRA